MTELLNAFTTNALNHISQQHWRHPGVDALIMPHLSGVPGQDYCSAAIYKKVQA